MGRGRGQNIRGEGLRKMVRRKKKSQSLKKRKKEPLKGGWREKRGGREKGGVKRNLLKRDSPKSSQKRWKNEPVQKREGTEGKPQKENF